MYKVFKCEAHQIVPPLPLQRLRATVRYLNSALRSAKSTAGGAGTVLGSIATEAGNFASLWDQTHEWLPRDIARMNEAGQSHVKDNLFPKLVDIIMPEAQGPDVSTAPVVSLAAALVEKRKARHKNHSNEGLAFLGTSMDHVRAQAITLCAVVDKQYEKAFSLVESNHR